MRGECPHGQRRIDVGEAQLAHALKVGNRSDSCRLPLRSMFFAQALIIDGLLVGACRYRADNTDREDSQMGTVKIDCDDCAVRGPGCQDCVVSVLLGVPETLLDDERRALEVLADVGLAPRLRLVPIHRDGDSGVA